MTSSPASPSAPTCLISYSHDSPEHQQKVLRIANELRANGVDATIDQYIQHSPPKSWPRWMRDQVKRSDFVLIVVTSTYADRFNGRTEASVGRGVDWEGQIITGELYSSLGSKVKFIPVVVDSSDIQHIPDILDQTTVHNLEPLSPATLDPLLRQILGEPAITPEPLGAPKFTLDNDPVKEAQSMLAVDENAAEERLTMLAGSADLETAARAAFALGEIYFRSNQYSRSAEAFMRAIQCGPGTTAHSDANREIHNVAAVMRHHFGPSSAGTFARDWVSSIQSGSETAVWNALDKDFRIALAQDWILANENQPTLKGIDRDYLANELRKIDSTHFLFQPFIESQMSKLGKIVDGFDDSWGLAEKPRRHGIDYEIVIFIPTENEYLIWEPNTELQTFPILIRRRLGEWKIAGTGVPPAIPVPGWPPTREEIPIDGVVYTGHPPSHDLP